VAPVVVSKPEYSREDRWHVMSASVTIDSKTFQLKFRASQGPLAEGSEPFLAATMLPAMKVAEPLKVPGPISPKLLAATQTLQEMFLKWFQGFQKIAIQANPGASYGENRATDVGAFFSGGVDSFYTFLKHEDEITKIILIHGFDMRLERTSLRAKVSREIRKIARELGKPLIEVETNIRHFSDQYTVIGEHYGGSLLASIGLLLSPQFRKIYIPSTDPYDHLFLENTHPLLDPLWSTESLTFEHDGCEAGRIEKVARIIQSDVAMRSLRVCFWNHDDSYNCCRCEKCLRTMVSLQALGALEHCTTFNQKLDIDAVSRMEIRREILYLVEENLRALENSGDNTELTEALRSCIRNFEYRELSNHLNENLPEFLASTRGAQFVSGKKNMIFKSLWRDEKEWFFREVVKEKLKELDQKFLFGMMQRVYFTQKGECNRSSIDE
jgi:hypothetical protein